MRDLINLMEAATRQPSAGLTEAALAWISGWHQNERDRVEALLMKNLTEARLFTHNSYPRLYRGMGATEEQERELRKGGSIEIITNHLMSWTKSRRVALDYAEGIGVIIAKSDLDPVLDIDMILPHLLRIDGVDGLDDHIRYAEREAEVICYSDSDMMVHARDVIWPDEE